MTNVFKSCSLGIRSESSSKARLEDITEFKACEWDDYSSPFQCPVCVRTQTGNCLLVGLSRRRGYFDVAKMAHRLNIGQKR